MSINKAGVSSKLTQTGEVALKQLLQQREQLITDFESKNLQWQAYLTALDVLEVDPRNRNSHIMDKLKGEADSIHNVIATLDNAIAILRSSSPKSEREK